MTKLLSGVAAAGALVLFSSAAFADCSGHNVTADAQSTKQTVAMSTFDGPVVQPASEGDKAAVTCAEGDKDCAPASK